MVGTCHLGTDNVIIEDWFCSGFTALTIVNTFNNNNNNNNTVYLFQAISPNARST